MRSCARMSPPACPRSAAASRWQRRADHRQRQRRLLAACRARRSPCRCRGRATREAQPVAGAEDVRGRDDVELVLGQLARRPPAARSTSATGRRSRRRARSERARVDRAQARLQRPVGDPLGVARRGGRPRCARSSRSRRSHDANSRRPIGPVTSRSRLSSGVSKLSPSASAGVAAHEGGRAQVDDRAGSSADVVGPRLAGRVSSLPSGAEEQARPARRAQRPVGRMAHEQRARRGSRRSRRCWS